MPSAEIDFNPHDWPNGEVRWSASYLNCDTLGYGASAAFDSPGEAVEWALYVAIQCRNCRSAPVHWDGGCDCECHGGVGRGAWKSGSTAHNRGED